MISSVLRLAHPEHLSRQLSPACVSAALARAHTHAWWLLACPIGMCLHRMPLEHAYYALLHAVPTQQTPDVTDIQPVPDAFVPMIGIKVRRYTGCCGCGGTASLCATGWRRHAQGQPRQGSKCRWPRWHALNTRTRTSCRTRCSPSYTRSLQYKGVQIDVLYASLAMHTLPEELDLANHAVLR